jgi:diaminohydroxyphosphoribosylaminopyrimidine deaminase / 5-amino-6-(5-phosphoribosylamino)uracil reductase
MSATAADPAAPPSVAMAEAVALGWGAAPAAAPNPGVGCVLVRGGVVVGRGATRPPGGAHAEVVALADAGDAARGATAFVSLEPCSHHGRTPPCTDALVAAGVARVVCALVDPDALVAGEGVRALRAAGIEVVVGDGAAAAATALEAYLHHRRTGRAFVVAKVALSADGRVAAADGSSRWLTGEAARAEVHALRARSQAVVVGSGTALADRPTLTARPALDRDALPLRQPLRQPLRVVLDARGRVPADGPLADTALAATLVLTSDAELSRVRTAWASGGAEVQAVAPGPDGGLDLGAVLARLGERGVLQCLVEGGGGVLGACLAGGHVGRLVGYVAPLALGTRGRPAVDHPGPATLADAPRWHLVDARVVGDDVRIEWVAGTVPSPGAPEPLPVEG